MAHLSKVGYLLKMWVVFISEVFSFSHEEPNLSRNAPKHWTSYDVASIPDPSDALDDIFHLKKQRNSE